MQILPIELLDLILDFCDAKTIYAFAQISSLGRFLTSKFLVPKNRVRFLEKRIKTYNKEGLTFAECFTQLPNGKMEGLYERTFAGNNSTSSKKDLVISGNFVLDKAEGLFVEESDEEESLYSIYRNNILIRQIYTNRVERVKTNTFFNHETEITSIMQERGYINDTLFGQKYSFGLTMTIKNNTISIMNHYDHDIFDRYEFTKTLKGLEL